MKNLILSTTPVDLTNIIPGVNYAATTSAVTYNKTPVVFGNKINYTTSGNTVMTFDTTKMYGSTGNQLNILSNVYENGLGTTTFDDKIITVSSALCSGNTDITSITVSGRINNLNCNNMFDYCYNLSGVSLNTSNVSNMSYMFSSCSKLSGISLNTSNVTNMDFMFMDTKSFNQDLSNWCMINITKKPNSFDKNTPNWNKTNRLPIWGTCPEQ